MKTTLTAHYALTCITLLGLSMPAPAAEAPKSYGPVPNERQIQWHELEMYGFLHFGPSTFANREWGFGDDKPDAFQPTAFDADKIVRAIKDGGLKGLILTAKHHDGFCLWPTKFSEHSVRNSPWKEGKGDVVKEIAEACKRHGIKFGIYVSPWDRNHPEYGEPGYVEYYKNTIRELLTNYGPVFEIWFDGACGGTGWYGGKNGSRKIDYNTYYDWKGIREIIHSLQPGCAIWGAQYQEGDKIHWADCRWGGSESGNVGNPCWSTMDSSKPVGRWGSGDRNGDTWCPAEADVSIRAGWFYHAHEDNLVKSPGTLMDIYFDSVGRGANLILNIPPDQRGLVHDKDAKALQGFRELMDQTFSVDLARTAKIKASGFRGQDRRFAPENLIDGQRDTYWTTDDTETTPEVVLSFEHPVTFNVVRLREYLPLGQRVDNWALDAWENDAWKEIANGAAVGNCRLVRLNDPLSTTQVRLRITKAPVCPAISELGLFMEPARLCVPKITRSREGAVKITREAGSAEIRYTLDGSEPGWNSPRFTAPIPLPKGGIVKACTVVPKEKKTSEVATESFDQSKAKWKILSITGNATSNADKAAYSAIDDSPRLWLSDPPPQDIVVDMGAELPVKGFTYLPRQDGKVTGMVDRYAFYLSSDGQTWGAPVSEGEFGNLRANPIKQTVTFPAVQKARYFKFVATHCLEGNQCAVAELGVISD